MIDYLLCADWCKEPKGRALYAADVHERRVFRIARRPLTIESALDTARELGGKGTVLLSFDLPLGLPKSYLSALGTVPGWEQTSNFVDFLSRATGLPGFFESGREASSWSLERPFFAVPPGKGGKLEFKAAAQRFGVQLRRTIDELTKGNPLFITSGIPGSVGSGAIDAWRALTRHLTPERDFKIWPFEGALAELFASTRIVVAENYPRAIYAAALSDLPSTRRHRIRLAKTHSEVRRPAIEHLLERPWLRDHQVRLNDVDVALGDENEFDALLTTAGLLRVLLDGEPLYSPDLVDPVAEGGILGTGTIDFLLSERDFGQFPVRRDASRPVKTASEKTPGKKREPTERALQEPRIYACPIPGCSKSFTGSRGGWDAHVGFLRQHPDWYPDVSGHRERLDLFREKFPSFFQQGG